MESFRCIRHPRKSDKDVFLADKLRNANFNTGFYQIPEIDDVDLDKPKDLVLWSNRHSCRNKACCGLVFYEFDSKFDGLKGIYNILKYGKEKQINKLISELREFAFVVCPDYSVYANFPNYKQIEALSKSREIGYILSTYNIKIVVNFRATYEWTYELALTGICYKAIVAIGTLGCLKDKGSRDLLKNSIIALVNHIKPRVIIVYGYAPTDIFDVAISSGSMIWQYNSSISKVFKGCE